MPTTMSYWCLSGEMMRQMFRRAFRRGRWRIAAGAVATGVVTAATVALATAAGPAGAASVNQWRTSNLWGASGNFTSVAATSKTNAWAVGNISSGPLAAHWNGHAWQTVAVPGSKGWAFEQVLAPSASNVWIYAVSLATSPTVFEQAFRFDGAHWHVVAFPDVANLGSLAVLGPRDAWLTATPMTTTACSSISGPCSDLWHWNGSTWTDTALKVNVTGLAGIPGTPVLWAVGVTGAQAVNLKGIITAYRWNGHVWQLATMPHIGADWPSVAIDAANDLWISYANVANTHGYSQHWNGAHWSTVNAGGAASTPALDGRGGAWFGPFSHWTGSAFVQVSIRSSDFSNSAWNLMAEAVVPGTSGASVWSAGWRIPNTFSSSVQRPVVAIYGPTP
jgi:hypothetical protein